MSASIELDSLSRHFGTAKAVDAISLTIEQGLLYVFLGPSGCGKSTTLRMIAGLEQPSSGRVVIGGQNMTDVPSYERDLGLVFQSYALFPHMTVASNVAFGLRMRRFPKAEIEALTQKALELVQLTDLANRRPSQLSGGQQQRVALARALVIEPRALLLDEPLSNLDKKLRGEMQLQIRALQQRLGITTVMVTHDQEEALALADRIVVMRDGKIEQVGTPQDLYRRPATRFVADFIGDANLLDGVLADDGTLQADGIRLPTALRGRSGSKVTLVLRPTDTTVRPVSGVDSSALAGTVIACQYLGSLNRITVRLPSGRDVVSDWVGIDAPPTEGSTVAVEYDPQRCHVVEEGL